MKPRTELRTEGRPVRSEGATRIAIQVRKRGASKVLQPDADASTTLDPVLLKALARGFYWSGLIERQIYADGRMLASALKIDVSIVNETLRLTLIAPDIVQAIWAGRQPRSMTLAMVQRRIPVDWSEQRQLWGLRPVRSQTSVLDQ